MNNLDLIYDIKAKKLSQNGNGIQHRITFEAISPRPLTSDLIAELQLNLGYHPAGYGGPWSISSESKRDDGTFRYTWQCSASCD